MSEQEMVDVAAILTTLAEVDGFVPASTVYLALGCDHGRYERTTFLCASAGLVVKTSETLEITEKGREVARKLEAAMA